MIKNFLKKRLPIITDFYRLTKSIKSVFLRTFFYKKIANRKCKILFPEKFGYRNLFCGYYDHSPFSISNTDWIIVHATNANASKKPSSKDSIDILLVDWKNDLLVEKIGSSNAWNWQQGCRAMWLSKDEIIYNVYNSGINKYESVIFNIGSKNEIKIPVPVQEISPNGANIFSFCYSALNRFRPDYGYRNIEKSPPNYQDNEILEFSLDNQKTETLIRIKDVVDATENRIKGKIYNYKFNHILASPDGKKFIFLFRYLFNEKRITDLYLYNLNIKNLELILNDKGVSHFCWVDNDRILFTGSINGAFGYYFISTKDLSLELLKITKDGHPSTSNNIFVTDTYPDSFGIRRLYLIDPLSNAKWMELAQFPESVLFHGETRCDFHPSLDHIGKNVQIDIAYKRNRSVAICNI